MKRINNTRTTKDFDYVEKTLWQFCKNTMYNNEPLATDRRGLAFRLATEPEDVYTDIMSFYYRTVEENNENYKAKLIGNMIANLQNNEMNKYTWSVK